ncbi:hypothetical protein NEAUS04_2425 [Nematocida ausubeli]|nr:hypothetical protein NEAUS04_2425 [Nematocida ausubeli]
MRVPNASSRRSLRTTDGLQSDNKLPTENAMCTTSELQPDNKLPTEDAMWAANELPTANALPSDNKLRADVSQASCDRLADKSGQIGSLYDPFQL